MLRSDAVTRINRGLDFGERSTDLIVAQLLESQRLLEKGKTLPRWLIQEDETMTVTVGTGEIALPTGFIREVEGESFYYVDDETDEPIMLEKMGLHEAKARFYGSDAARPQAYVLRNDTVAFFPERSEEVALLWSYYKKASLLDTDIENEWLANNPEALIGHAGMVLAKDLGNPGATQRFTDLFNEAWGNQFKEDIERERDNDPLIMGGRA